MVTSVTPASLVAIILTGSYPENTLTIDNVYPYDQVRLRRRYPSCQVVVVQPESTEESQKATNKTLGFEITYYSKVLGQASDEVVTQKTVEDTILSLMESATLEDPNIILESKNWDRSFVQRDGSFPPHIKSTLKITIRNIILSTAPSNALLTFDLSHSSVASAPSGNYQYTEVYDASIIYGYNSIEEIVTTNTLGDGIPIRFRCKFRGKAIFNIYAKTGDFGTTGDKLNQLNTLLSGGEKPEIGLIFQAYDATSPTPRKSISTTFRVDIDEVQQIANFNDNVVFRVIGSLNRPPTITDA